MHAPCRLILTTPYAQHKPHNAGPRRTHAVTPLQQHTHAATAAHTRHNSTHMLQQQQTPAAATARTCRHNSTHMPQQQHAHAASTAHTCRNNSTHTHTHTHTHTRATQHTHACRNNSALTGRNTAHTCCNNTTHTPGHSTHMPKQQHTPAATTAPPSHSAHIHTCLRQQQHYNWVAPCVGNTQGPAGYSTLATQPHVGRGCCLDAHRCFSYAGL